MILYDDENGFRKCFFYNYNTLTFFFNFCQKNFLITFTRPHLRLKNKLPILNNF